MLCHIDSKSFYSVTVTEDEVVAFGTTWPCANLPTRAFWFQFERTSGDLVDMTPYDAEENGADGAAIVAMSHDAQKFAGTYLPEAEQHAKDRDY